MIALDSKFENDTFMVLVQLDDGTKWIKFSNPAHHNPFLFIF